MCERSNSAFGALVKSIHLDMCLDFAPFFAQTAYKLVNEMFYSLSSESKHPRTFKPLIYLNYWTLHLSSIVENIARNNLRGIKCRTSQ